MDLASYLALKKLSHAAFADQVGVTQASITRYVAGDRIPRPVILARIAEATGGAVTANDFMAAREGAPLGELSQRVA